MRMFTLTADHAGGTLSNGTAAPALPQHNAIPVSSIKSVSLNIMLKPGTADVIQAQLLALQLVGGESLPIIINRAPEDAGKRQTILDKFTQLVAALADDTQLTIQWSYQEIT
jgi:hypothetical protein